MGKNKYSEKEIINIKYELSEDEIFETFRLRSRKKISYRIMQVVSFLVSLMICFFIYLLTDDMAFMWIMLVIVIFFTFTIMYPEMRMRKAAKTLFEKNEKYYIKLSSDGTIDSNYIKNKKLNDFKKVISVETKRLFYLKIENNYSLCIPKRYISDDDEVQLRDFLAAKTEFLNLYKEYANKEN